MKKTIAVWLYGGIGTGNFSQGQPVLEKLVRELCHDFEITVYSRSLINEDFAPEGYRLKCAPRWVHRDFFRWMWLVFHFLSDHCRKKYKAVIAFWGFPGGFIATILAKILGLPSMINLQGGDCIGIPSLNYGIMHRPWLRRMALWAYQRSTVLTTLTFFQRDLVTRQGVKRPVSVIPFGADRMLFGNLARVTKANKPLHFLHVANYNPIKDTPTLLRTFSVIHQQKECHLRIVGGGYEQSGYLQLCIELGIESHVEFIGPVAYQDIHRHFEWADFFLHTSLYEGQGIVVAEAAMSGVLIAGTAVGLISDLGDQAAILVQPGDYSSLADKLLQVIRSLESGVRMIAAAHAWAVEHDFRWTVSKFREIIDEII